MDSNISLGTDMVDTSARSGAEEDGGGAGASLRGVTK